MSQPTPSTGLPVSPIAYGNPCGCKYYIGQQPPIEFCPLHAQAGAMLELVKQRLICKEGCGHLWCVEARALLAKVDERSQP